MRLAPMIAMRRLVRKLKLALAGLVGGFAFACSAPTNPGEMPPLAPRPEPVQPTPSNAPVPGAGDPLKKAMTPDAGAAVSVPAPQFNSSAEPQAPADAGVDAVLPEEIPDALPPDANRQPQAAGFHCC